GGHRYRHRRLLPAPPPPGVPAVPEKGRRRLPRHRAARGMRQLRRAQARRRPRLAREETADYPALHPDRMLLAQPRRVLLLDHHPPGHPPRLLHLSPPADSNDRRVHRSLERPPPALRLDQRRRRDPPQDPPCED